ncbi:hypothetical protein CPB83DRAFT_849817 [Crepidotus variabilis]|uniref:Uncharacterized protein n=1 Tax=Crepidotus variabilis TaxID=179855 RepID=A0A9P6ELP8_9AGAR|nr:hypothetical protein CPB83DRAFT_849817 [Crepidotus variabilis]
MMRHSWHSHETACMLFWGGYICHVHFQRFGLAYLVWGIRRRAREGGGPRPQASKP